MISMEEAEGLGRALAWVTSLNEYERGNISPQQFKEVSDQLNDESPDGIPVGQFVLRILYTTANTLECTIDDLLAELGRRIANGE